MEVTKYIQPELLILVPMLYIIGAFIKSCLNEVESRYIPVVLGILGVLMSVLWVASTESQDQSLAVFNAIVQGVLCAGAAVYGHELWKQGHKERRKADKEADIK